MKYLSLIWAVLICSVASAQEPIDLETEINNSFSTRKKEIGVIMQNNYGSNEVRGDLLLGIQYKKWLKPSKALKIFVAFNPSTYSKQPIIQSFINSDTVNVLYRNYKSNGLALGIGSEVQRHFFKRIYMAAGLDLVGGYGKGSYSTYNTIGIVTGNGNINPVMNVITNQKTVDYSKFYISANPYVGTKVIFNRLDYGVEFSFLNLTAYNENTDGNNYFSTEFDMFSSSSFRFYFNFRF